MYIITSYRNNKPYSFYHSNERFYCAIFSTTDCHLKKYKTFNGAKKAYDKLNFKGAGLAILKVEKGQSIEQGAEVCFKID